MSGVGGNGGGGGMRGGRLGRSGGLYFLWWLMRLRCNLSFFCPGGLTFPLRDWSGYLTHSLPSLLFLSFSFSFILSLFLSLPMDGDFLQTILYHIFINVYFIYCLLSSFFSLSLALPLSFLYSPQSHSRLFFFISLDVSLPFNDKKKNGWIPVSASIA